MVWVLLAIAIVTCTLVKEEARATFNPVFPSSSSKANPRTTMMKISEDDKKNNQDDIDEEGFHSRKLQAAVALHGMEAREVMATEFTTTPQSLFVEKAFLRQWKPCVLERIFQQKGKRQRKNQDVVLTVTVDGGSTASRPADRCGSNDRFSDKLNEKFHHDSMALPSLQNSTNSQFHKALLKFQVHNFAQGGVNSITSAMLMDGYIRPNETDVIVWDHLVNDGASGGGEEEQLRKLDFWLRRVGALYANARRNPPAIVILDLWVWDSRVHVENNDGLRTLDGGAWRNTGPLIDSYRALGWDIAMVNVGAVVNVTTLRSIGPSFFFDDNHHPACPTVHLIASMLQHVFYTNLASPECDMEELLEINEHAPAIPRPPPPQQTTPAGRESFEELWKDLFWEDATIGSISGWEPKIQHLSNLRIDNWQSISNRTKQLTGGAEDGRRDRKYAFRLPRCDDELHLEVRLKEPNLKWIGFKLEGQTPKVHVNNVLVNLTKVSAQGWCYGTTYLSHWLPILDQKADEHVVSFCGPVPGALLHFLIGVAYPGTSAGS